MQLALRVNTDGLGEKKIWLDNKFTETRQNVLISFGLNSIYLGAPTLDIHENCSFSLWLPEKWSHHVKATWSFRVDRRPSKDVWRRQQYAYTLMMGSLAAFFARLDKSRGNDRK
jgi:hypothetical protein